MVGPVVSLWSRKVVTWPVGGRAVVRGQYEDENRHRDACEAIN